MIMDAAIKSAMHYQVPGAIAIVDSHGYPILLECLDDTMSSAATIALGKAATAATFKRPTIELENVILNGRTPMLVLDGASPMTYVPLKGAYPIIYEGQIIGAIAVAGTMDAEMDEIIALEALEKGVLCTVK